MNLPEVIVAIMIAVLVASIVRTRIRHQGDRGVEPAPTAEMTQLRREVDQLKERLAVLERITVERENSLARQIDDLKNQ